MDSLKANRGVPPVGNGKNKRKLSLAHVAYHDRFHLIILASSITLATELTVPIQTQVLKLACTMSCLAPIETNKCVKLNSHVDKRFCNKIKSLINIRVRINNNSV